MSIFGYEVESDTTIRATTIPVMLNIRHSGFIGDAEPPIPPTPDLYTQLLKKIAEIQSGANGKDGLSAYELAKENGFVGTLDEWLESLKGKDGKLDCTAITIAEIDAILNGSMSDDPDNPDAEEITNEEIDRLF
ncbi:MAG: hypothetical protein Q4D37_10640 [Oscillospiraceae bacterium]|nr:hypothetical protein [Oscillospiraceae bacterium]